MLKSKAKREAPLFPLLPPVKKFTAESKDKGKSKFQPLSFNLTKFSADCDTACLKSLRFLG